jgi:hypothetical protein
LPARALRCCVALLALGCRGAAREPEAPPAEPASAPVARPYHPSLRDVMTERSRRALDDATVTLLVPDDPGLVATAVVTSGPLWAAISITRGDHALTVHASRGGSRVPEGAADAAREDRLRAAPATIVAREGQRVATWEERGVTYVLDLSCARPDDPRCARDRYLRELASALVPLGGAR